MGSPASTKSALFMLGWEMKAGDRDFVILSPFFMMMLPGNEYLEIILDF